MLAHEKAFAYSGDRGARACVLPASRESRGTTQKLQARDGRGESTAKWGKAESWLAPVFRVRERSAKITHRAMCMERGRSAYWEAVPWECGG